MIKLLRITRMELKTGFRSRKFWLVVLVLTLFMVFDSIPEYLNGRYVEAGRTVFRTDIISMNLYILQGASYLFWLRFCLYVIPYGTCFLEEYENRAAKYRLFRSTVVEYGLGKLFGCILLTSSAVLLSELCYLGVFRLLGVPLLLPMAGENDVNYQLYRLIAEGQGGTFWLLMAGFSCFAGIFFSSMTLMLSAFVKNKYLLTAIPLTVFFSLDSFSGLFFSNGVSEGLFHGMMQPDIINWRMLFFSLLDGGVMTETQAVLRTAIYTAAAVILFGILFLLGVRKAVKNE